ncbi:hypothetical protein QR680_000070 [Steinernema hermaphroditum]|uniref:Uncharacterized protein n=1 Tax=Steinernema hermaphroditum TaxID=289476 RepID=A0AA39GU18_9BILA|nr:hypothetical protein QR680_000070 [Steinernema hermaphroditum]
MVAFTLLRADHGSDVPYQEMGFPTIEAYLRSIPDRIRIVYDKSGKAIVEAIETDERETFVEFAKSMVPCYYDILASEVLHYFNADISNVKALCEVLGVNGSTRIVALKIEPKNAFILPPNAPINYKTMMCRRYQKNQVCWKYCTYAHGFHEMRTIAENQAYRAQQRTKKNTSEIRHPDNENIENDVPIHCADRPYCENSEEEREIRELCEWVEKEVENMEFQEVPYRSLSSSPENILGFDNYAEFLVDTMEKLNISIMALDVPKMLETQFNFNAADYDKYDEELMYFMKGLVDYSKSKLRLKFVNNLLSRGDALQRILFTDEKIFTVEPFRNSQNQREVLPKGSPRIVKADNTHFSKSVMVWGGISGLGKTKLVFVPKGVKISADTYRQLILEDAVLPWAEENAENIDWCLQQDWAPAHGAKKTIEWCEANLPGFWTKSVWPSNSPDLNPLDFAIWGILEQKACAIKHKSIDSLKRALEKAWEEITPEMIAAILKNF